MTKIVILYTEAGGGHKSTALALQEVIIKYTPWQVQLVNPYKELCLDFDIVKKVFGISSEELYNKYVANNNNALLKLLIIAGIFKINLFLHSKQIVRRLTTAWQKLQPNMIISVTPFINTLISESAMQLPQTIHFVTLITDYRECTKNIWITKKAQNIVCCSETLVKQAVKRGLNKENIFRISGMLVSGKYYAVMRTDKNELRKNLGLQTGIPTAIVIFGSHGSDDMLQIAKNMNSCSFKIQIIFICGHNEKLKQAISSLQVNYPCAITGFVNNVEQYMRCADLFIGKPGGLAVTEAAIMHLPLILKFNAFTLLHERHNAQWAVDNKIAIVVKNFNNIQVTVKNVLENSSFFMANLNILHNRAYFEITSILEHVMKVKSHKLQQTLLEANALE